MIHLAQFAEYDTLTAEMSSIHTDTSIAKPSPATQYIHLSPVNVRDGDRCIYVLRCLINSVPPYRTLQKANGLYVPLLILRPYLASVTDKMPNIQAVVQVAVGRKTKRGLWLRFLAVPVASFHIHRYPSTANEGRSCP
jgi:hypothetical protein